MERVGLNKISFKEGVVMQKKVKLGDIATLITKGTTPTSIGYSFVDSGVNFIKIESLNDQGGFIPEKFAFISEDCNAKMQRSQLHENDILFSIAGAIGKKAVVSNNILPANTNQALAIIRIPKGKINHQYLFYALESDGIKKQFEKQKQGVAQLNLSLKDISEIEINLVSQEEQDKTVAVIGNVDKLIDKRKQQLQKLDELVKTRFVEMFGYTLDNGYIKKLEDVSIKITDGEHGTVPRCEGGRRYLMARNITANNQLDLTDVAYIEEAVHQKIYSRCNPEFDDLLLVCVGATIGKVTLIPQMDDFSIARSVALIKYDRNELDGRFLLWQFNMDFMQNQLKTSSNESAQAGLYIGKIKELKVIVPPIVLQREFSTFVQQTDKSKLEVQKSLEKLETLKKALMQKYFG